MGRKPEDCRQPGLAGRSRPVAHALDLNASHGYVPFRKAGLLQVQASQRPSLLRMRAPKRVNRATLWPGGRVPIR
jgi:hypothetical protein